ncbi:hypothetical protein EG68_07510 [Paragonimus skrjabini miyazakii]|uniref:carbonyl reductase (NADPH) n=1 Tax=Paragonimus skrjabini miyazakii TaxID=59628 RepID=A0A8S9YL75_9TREM|nr:hypothetical protein EG68_07510 [Paragonimus skrjabini miyazakii]
MKVALVTGANKGIGYALVEKLAKHYTSSDDWHIYLTARDNERGKMACEKLKQSGLQVKFHQLDITDENSRKTLIAFMKKTYSNGINVIVNNAGIAYKNDAPELFGENARITVDTNFTSNVDFTLDCLPLMVEDARIVNVCSMLARVAYKRLSDQLASKFNSPMTLDQLRLLMNEFVKHAEAGDHEKFGWPSLTYGVSKLGFTKATYILADMLKNDPRKIIINACCPGYVDTDMTDHKGSKTPEQGADTLFYLATLPPGVTEPFGQFVHDRKVHKFLKT